MLCAGGVALVAEGVQALPSPAVKATAVTMPTTQCQGLGDVVPAVFSVGDTGLVLGLVLRLGLVMVLISPPG